MSLVAAFSDVDRMAILIENHGGSSWDIFANEIDEDVAWGEAIFTHRDVGCRSRQVRARDERLRGSKAEVSCGVIFRRLGSVNHISLDLGSSECCEQSQCGIGEHC